MQLIAEQAPPEAGPSARARATAAAAVLPALLPGALVVVLGLQQGGFFPDSYSLAACAAAVVLALYVTIARRPAAGLSPTGAIALAGLALLAVWMLLSSQWSHAPGRALVEFNRALLYVLVLALCVLPPARETKLAWALRGVALGIAIVCGLALATRLAPDSFHHGDLGRLSWPITYWNGLGVLAAAGFVLALHLAAFEREPWPVRILAAALLPGLACTVYLTLSRGAIAASAVGLVVYVLVGRPRGLLGALIAAGPACAIAVVAAYDAEALVDSAATLGALRADGHHLAHVLALCTAGTVALRALTLPLDAFLARLQWRVPRAVTASAVAVLVLAAAGVAVKAGVPGYVHRQADGFFSGNPIHASDPRDRLLAVTNNGRTRHWRIALDQYRAAPWHGEGAGTYENAWNRERDIPFPVLDGHSLYVETLGELGIPGLAFVLVALGAAAVGIAMRTRGPARPAYAAVLAAGAVWAVHAGIDWDWEQTAISVWVFGLAGIALARPVQPGGARAGLPVIRVLAALGCLFVAVQPALMWRSQTRAVDAVQAFRAGDCPAAVDAALDSLAAVNARSDPWELLAYCDIGAGRRDLAVRAARAAVARDPDNWGTHYALALVLGASGQDPRAEARTALRLNPLSLQAQYAVKELRGDDPARWRRVAHRLPLNFA